MVGVGISDEFRQRGEGDYDIRGEWMGLVELGKEPLDMGLVLQHHHPQKLRRIDSLGPH